MSNSGRLQGQVASAFFGDFVNLRPIQNAAIPPLLAGENVVLSSGTGSGKTEAVVAPLISRYWRQAVETDSVVVLYIAPTKALANDLEKRLQPPLENSVSESASGMATETTWPLGSTQASCSRLQNRLR